MDQQPGSGHNRQIKEHPAVKIEREATGASTRLAENFGMNPVGLVRLELAELHRRCLEMEIHDALGPPDLRPI